LRPCSSVMLSAESGAMGGLRALRIVVH